MPQSPWPAHIIFEETFRRSKILQSIKADFKKATGKDLDINIMTRDMYRRAKNGEFKADVEKIVLKSKHGKND